MQTRAHPPGLQDVLEFPLVEALYGRRARRFSLGASIPDGPLAFTSQHDPLPLSTYARPDALWRSQLNFWRWLAEVAPSERAFFEAFFTWVYTPRAHADGTVAQIVEEALAFPHKQSVEAFQAQVDVCLTHDTADRLLEITAPTLVLSGELDIILPPRIGRSVAARIPNARFEVMPGEAHQPFQEVPDEFNARVEAFWREVEARG
jgi:pimeloyl-ACP methyl ester carboxylesterase